MRTLKLLTLASLALATPALAADADRDGIADALDAFPCDASAASVVHVPRDGVHGMVLFEDRWPANGDLDFNDAVVAYNYVLRLNGQGQVTSLQLNLNLLAVGGTFTNDLMLRLPVPATYVASVHRTAEDGTVDTVALAPGETQTVFPLVRHLQSHFNWWEASFVNTDPAQPAVAGKALNFQVRFSNPVSLSLSAAPYDLFLARTDNPGHQIHLPQYAGTARMDTSLFRTQDDASSTGSTGLRFVNRQGLPFALKLPEVRPWARETQPLDTVYPDLVRFAASGGSQAQDWYRSRVELSHAFTQGSNAMAPPVPVTIGSQAAPDTSCVGVTTTFSGVANELPLASLLGWNQCYAGRYTEFVSLASIQGNCDKPNVMLACRKLGSTTLQVAAHAPRASVFATNAGPALVRPAAANGTGWYFSNDYSWGFAPEGATVRLNSCDTMDSPWSAVDEGHGHQRLCWHTTWGALDGGWRCGNDIELNADSNWERLVFEAD